jgi:hypothetical protein
LAEKLQPWTSTAVRVQVTDARDGQSRTIRQFHFTDWPEQGVPKSGEGFIDFIGQVHKTKEQFGQEGPITVHCRYTFTNQRPLQVYIDQSPSSAGIH